MHVSLSGSLGAASLFLPAAIATNLSAAGGRVSSGLAVP